MSHDKSEFKVAPKVESYSGRLGVMHNELKTDSSVELQTALQSTYPDMPKPLYGIISHYLLSDDMKQHIIDYQNETPRDAAKLSKKLLDGFDYQILKCLLCWTV